MQFLPDVYVPCEECHGKRYNREALEIKYKGKTIADVLDMTVEEALSFFENIPASVTSSIRSIAVGLGYIRLGQPATTLSGGEAQRVKLAKELTRRATGNTLYILDEPTTGLHFADVRKLLEVLHESGNTGNTVLVIEHNLDVIKSATGSSTWGRKAASRAAALSSRARRNTLRRSPGPTPASFCRESCPHRLRIRRWRPHPLSPWRRRG